MCALTVRVWGIKRVDDNFAGFFVVVEGFEDFELIILPKIILN